MLGPAVGAGLYNVGTSVGAAEGAPVGTSVGREGALVGVTEGAEEGVLVGTIVDGRPVGTKLGVAEGAAEGESEGFAVGAVLGLAEGAWVEHTTLIFRPICQLVVAATCHGWVMSSGCQAWSLTYIHPVSLPTRSLIIHCLRKWS